ncbi:hypothetical protein [Immundisolibacter sp.]|uniref:hypothetical protein n=1 Tax=Immundisolibacter sp. TaxID=1934948 RepID=UPI003F85CD8F
MKDVDFALHQVTVRDGKGSKDRVTMLRWCVGMPLRAHLAQVSSMHDTDLSRTVQDLSGHLDVSTTMIYTQALSRGARRRSVRWTEFTLGESG